MGSLRDLFRHKKSSKDNKDGPCYDLDQQITSTEVFTPNKKKLSRRASCSHPGEATKTSETEETLDASRSSIGGRRRRRRGGRNKPTKKSETQELADIFKMANELETLAEKARRAKLQRSKCAKYKDISGLDDPFNSSISAFHKRQSLSHTTIEQEPDLVKARRALAA